MARYDLPNLLEMFDTSLSSIEKKLENGDIEGATQTIIIMHKAIWRIKTRCGWCEEHIIDNI